MAIHAGQSLRSRYKPSRERISPTRATGSNLNSGPLWRCLFRTRDKTLPLPIAGMKTCFITETKRAVGGGGRPYFQCFGHLLDAIRTVSVGESANIALRPSIGLRIVAALAILIHYVVVGCRKSARIEEVFVLADAQPPRLEAL